MKVAAILAFAAAAVLMFCCAAAALDRGKKGRAVISALGCCTSLAALAAVLLCG